MPCKDTTSKIIVRFDPQERLTHLDYSKITCGKEIGGDTGFGEFCSGRMLKEIETIDFQSALDSLPLSRSEDQFLLYLEWEALMAAIALYLGNRQAGSERYQLVSVEFEEEGVKIQVNIRPPEDMPKILSCAVRARNPAKSSRV